jgi:hypothetical protein
MLKPHFTSEMKRQEGEMYRFGMLNSLFAASFVSYQFCLFVGRLINIGGVHINTLD